MANDVQLLMDGDEETSLLVALMRGDREGVAKALAVTKEEQMEAMRRDDYLRVAAAFYVVIRDAIVVLPPDGGRFEEDDQGRPALMQPGHPFQQRREAVRQAAKSICEPLATQYLVRETLETPAWAEDIASRLSRHPDADIRKAWADVSVRLVPTPNPELRIVGSEITISTVMRGFLCNLFLPLGNWLNNDGLRQEVRYDDEDFVGSILEYWVAFCLYPNREMHPQALPAPVFDNKKSFQFCQLIAKVQMTFIVLHELGHHIKDNADRFDTVIETGRFADGKLGSYGVEAGQVYLMRDPAGMSDEDRAAWAKDPLNLDYRFNIEVDAFTRDEADIDEFAFTALCAIFDPEEATLAVLSLLDFLNMTEALRYRDIVDDLPRGRRASNFYIGSSVASLRKQIFEHEHAQGWAAAVEDRREVDGESLAIKDAYYVFKEWSARFVKFAATVEDETLERIVKRRQYGWRGSLL